MINRYVHNPILNTKDISPSQTDFIVECVLNPGVFRFEDKIWLLLRVAERPIQKIGMISLPILTDNAVKIIEFQLDDPDLDLSDSRMVKHKGKVYLSTLSHLRLVSSTDGIHFSEPGNSITKIFGEGPLESFGIEDARVSFIDGLYFLTYTQVSDHGVGVGLMQTADWKNFIRRGMIIPPHNKDCALFEEKIDNKYYCFHRPSGIEIGGNYIWIASSTDLIHWGHHQCIVKTREGFWDSTRVGAGAAPIKTDQGWLEIYHGADEKNRYALGVILLDLKDPSKLIARSIKPILEPSEPYEIKGFFGNVVFTNGHLIDGDRITLYYGASDEVICQATFSIQTLLDDLLK